MKFYTFCELSLWQIYKVKGLSESYQRQVSLNNISTQSRGFSWEFLVGVCRPVLQILTVFQTWPSKIHTRFQTWSGHKTQHYMFT